MNKKSNVKNPILLTSNDINETEPLELFEDINETEPLELFEDINETEPLQLFEDTNVQLIDFYESIDNYKVEGHSKTNTVIFSGNRGNTQITTTIKRYDSGCIVNNSSFSKDYTAKNILVKQVKDLSKEGYKQVDIARMLGISQATVSIYLNKE